jgi:hypothetical protein
MAHPRAGDRALRLGASGRGAVRTGADVGQKMTAAAGWCDGQVLEEPRRVGNQSTLQGGILHARSGPEQPPGSKKRPQRRGNSGRLSRGLSAVKRQKFGRSAERASMWRCRSSPRKSSHRNRKEETRRKTLQAPSTKKSAMTSRPARILPNVQSGKSVWDF